MEFFKRLKQLFSLSPSCGALPAQHHEHKEDSPPQLLLHEPIERTESEQQQYSQWASSTCKPQMLQWIYEQYRIFLQTPRGTDAGIDFLVIPSVKGFVLHYDPERWDCDDFVHLFDYFKHQSKTLGYFSQVSDHKVFRCGNKLESVQRHFMKPPSRLAAPEVPQRLDQFYGNIMISLCLINEKLVNLKFSATHYNDHAYLPPRPFDELLQKLLISNP